MTRNVGLRGHPGLKRDGCISIHRYYEPTKFRQNRKGSGQLVIDLTWNDPKITQNIIKLQCELKPYCSGLSLESNPNNKAQTKLWLD